LLWTNINGCWEEKKRNSFKKRALDKDIKYRRGANCYNMEMSTGITQFIKYIYINKFLQKRIQKERKIEGKRQEL
jgi:hypothetical protein